METKIKVKTGNNPLVSHKFTEQHLTSQCFMRPTPVGIWEVFPKRSASIRHKEFDRLLPMPVPTFGKAVVYNRAFYVPYRTVFRPFTSFINSTPSNFYTDSSTGQYIPTISNADLLGVIMDNRNSVDGTLSVHDFVAYYRDQAVYKSLTPSGKFILKLLQSLGYRINFNDNDVSRYSLLRLFCYIKVLIDWYYPSAYSWNVNYRYFENILNANDDSIYPRIVWTNFFKNLVDIAYCEYEKSYLTSAWDNPLGPNDYSASADITIRDITFDNNQFVTNDPSINNPNEFRGTPRVDGDSVKFTQYLDDALKSLTDYTKRHQLVGVRALDRMLAEFGVNLQSEILKRSIYFGEQKHFVQFGDVVSHADTDNANLGAFAGKAIAYGERGFDLDSVDEHGVVIVINSIVPIVGYYQGQDRGTMMKSLLDFWHGDFDNLGVDAVSMREVYTDYDGDGDYSSGGYSDPSIHNLNDQIFGFVPRYAHMKVAHDKVTGIFNYKSENLGLNAYYLMRDLHRVVGNDIPRGGVHSMNFVIGTDFDTYNRLFYSEKLVDQILCDHVFEVDFKDRSKKVFDTYEFDESKFEDVTMNIGGTTVN